MHAKLSCMHVIDVLIFRHMTHNNASWQVYITFVVPDFLVGVEVCTGDFHTPNVKVLYDFHNNRVHLAMSL